MTPLIYLLNNLFAIKEIFIKSATDYLSRGELNEKITTRSNVGSGPIGHADGIGVLLLFSVAGKPFVRVFYLSRYRGLFLL